MKRRLVTLLDWRPTLVGYIAGAVTVLLVLQLVEMTR